MRLFATDWEPTTDDWYTPPAIFTALGIDFDLDPAAPPGGVPWVPAKEFYTEADDGLLQPWSGRVWLNPPYSAPALWLERFRDHDDGVALVAADTSTAATQGLLASAQGVCFIRHRLRFVRFDASVETSARFPSLLVGYGSVGGAAVRQCGLGWVP